MKFKFNKKNCANSGDICGAFPYKSFPNWVNYSDELLQYGMVNYLEVLTAKDNALNTEINYIDNKYIFIVSTDLLFQGFYDLKGNPLLMLDGVLSLQKNLIFNKNYLITYGDDNIVHIWDKNVLLNSKYNQDLYDENIMDMLSYTIGGNPSEMFEREYSSEDIDLLIKNQFIDINYKYNS